ncbi:MAG: UDP-3-O-(3-hydroxymyristoyl)glucosamine N-acyltransferase [Acidobacteria bacterium]|nr:UDP-3-O-(3-hydroxymyristoyl)glucosamine N-acyltransferase [Acidobacteriota bacterium]
MAFRLGDLAADLGGRVVGDPDRVVRSFTNLELAEPGDLSFLKDARFRDRAAASQAAALVVAPGVEVPGKDLLEVEDPGLAAARLAVRFFPPPPRPASIHPTAVLDAAAKVDPSAHVGPFVVIESETVIGPGAVLLSGVVVGRRCRVGEGAVLHPHSVLYDDTEVGAGAVIHAGAVVGSDGFGYVTRRGVHHKVPQVGRAVIGEEVEIGANSAVDRATFGETVIGAGTKIDNLVQVGHNVQMGEACILSGQAGVAGSAVIGNGVVLGGQAGCAGHLSVGDGVQVAAKSAVFQSLEAGAKVGGVPAVDLRQWRRQVTALARLQDFVRRLRALERAKEQGGGE